MATKEKVKKYTSPKGRWIYPRLFTPDVKFKKEGTYSVRVAFAPEIAAPLMAQIDAAIDQAVKDTTASEMERYNTEKAEGKKGLTKPVIKRADAPYKTDEDAGEIIFNFKMTASGEYRSGERKGEKWERRPAVFGPDLKPLGPDTKIGGGTIGRISYSLSPFFTKLVGAGVSLRLEAAQVVTLVEWVPGGDAASHGFEREADDETHNAPETEGESDGGDF